MTLGALALGAANALDLRWTYPNCDTTNCYNELVDARFYAEAETFCPEFLAGTTTAASAIPTDFSNCQGDVSAVSSACSCITYTMTHTTGSSTAPPTTTTTTPPTTSSSPTTSSIPTTATLPPPTTTLYSSSSSPSGTVTSPSSSTTPASSVSTTSTPNGSYTSSSSSSITLYSTSTIYTTSVSTIYSCAPTVTSCPYRTSSGTVPASYTVTTATISLTTTICPVTTIPVVTTPVYSTETIYSTVESTIYSCAPEVTSCPYRSSSGTVSATYTVTTTVVPCSTSVYTSYATSMPAGETLTSAPGGILSSVVPPKSTPASNGTITASTSAITKPSPSQSVVPASGADRVIGGFATMAAGLMAAIFFL
jgi:hypothetical protein